MTYQGIKKVIAKFMGEGFTNDDTLSYDELLKLIHENQYRLIMKVPIDMFFMGIIKRYKHPTISLSLIKDVVIDVLQSDGIETTFTDADWDNLEIIKGGANRWDYDHINTKKNYMIEFFEP